MTDDREKRNIETDRHDCDIKVWSDSCRRDEFTSNSDKYLCASCGKISVLDHEMHHEHFPHMSGDKDNLS
jgi:hypothetical protein